MASTTTTLLTSSSTLLLPPFSNHSYRSSSASTIIAITSHRRISSSVAISTTCRRAISSPDTGVVVDEQSEDEEDPLDSQDASSISSLTGCKACGREEIESGCNGEGRIQGGIATGPGFGWWPIKAYRPCPAYLASGGRYRRTGQSMDDVVSGRGREPADGTTAGAKSRKKKDGPRKFKR